MAPRERQLAPEVFYTEYMSSEDSEYEDQEDIITGEKETKLVRYVRKELTWEKQNLKNIKAKLDRAHYNNLTPHARAMAKPRHAGGVLGRPAHDGPAWAVRQQASTD